MEIWGKLSVWCVSYLANTFIENIVPCLGILLEDSKRFCFTQFDQSCSYIRLGMTAKQLITLNLDIIVHNVICILYFLNLF